jgi:hypothetical protein
MPRNLRLEETQFRGIEAGTSPERMPKGTLQVADNVFLDGPIPDSGAALTTRPGAQGQLATALTSKLWDNQVYKTTAGTSQVFFAYGNGSNTAGSIVRWTKDATAVTGLTALGTFAETATRFTRLNNYVFIIGNTDGSLRRFSPDAATAEIAVGIATPTYTPVVSAVSLPLYDSGGTTSVFAKATSFGADTIPTGTFTVIQSDFSTGFTTSRNPGQELCHVSAWLVTGSGTVTECASGVDSQYPGKTYVRLDDPGSGFTSDTTGLLANKAKANAGGLGAGARKAVKFQLTFRMLSTSSDDSVLASVIIYDTGQTEITRLTQEFKNTSLNASATQSKTYSFGSLIDDTGIFYVGIAFQSGTGSHPGSNGPYVTDVTLTANEPSVTFTQNGSAVDVAGLLAYAPNQTDVLFGQQRFTYNLSAATDYSTYSQVAALYNPYYDFTNFRARFALRGGTAGTAYYTNDVQVVQDTNGKSYLAADVSTIPAANRTAIQYVDVFFPQDFSLVAPAINQGQSLFSLGALSQAGNLSTDLDYSYRIVEKDTATQIVSGGGPISIAITPTLYSAAGNVNLTAQTTLPQSTAANAISVYRRGGSFPDAAFRKVAEFAPGTPTSTTYYQWNTATHVFTDNTPDSVLTLNAPGAIDYFFRDHQPPPTACRAISVYQSRLVLATDTELWVSQIPNVVAATGLYFNRFQDPADPDPGDLGFYTRVTGGDGSAVGDAVQKMVPYRELLVIFFQTCIYLFGGIDATDFYLRRFEGDDGKGLIAPLATQVLDNQLYYLAADGVRAFDLVNTIRASRAIDTLLSPKDTFSGSALLAAAFREASFVGHADRLFVNVPIDSTVNHPNVTYVLDRRMIGRDGLATWPPFKVGEWTRWKVGELSNGFVLSSSGDTNDFYLTGPMVAGTTAGQIFKVGSAFGDKYLPSHSVTGVPMVVVGRALGGGIAELYAQRLSVALQGADVFTASFAVSASQGAESPAPYTWTGNYVYPAGGGSARRLKVSDYVRGRLLEWSVAATATTAAITLQRVGMEATTGREL